MPKIKPKLLTNSRKLRSQQTDAENIIWGHLRGRRLAEFRFRRQKVFGTYIADFYCAKAKLIIELDGSQHLEETTIKYDKKRTEFLESKGLKVVRFFSNDVCQNTEGVLTVILEELGI